MFSACDIVFILCSSTTLTYYFKIAHIPDRPLEQLMGNYDHLSSLEKLMVMKIEYQ